ncbi:MAG TPA: ATP-dependent DNA helicase, partial [Candidatus Eisenbacteria bacterium]
DPDELHDALLVSGTLTDEEMARWPEWRDRLEAAGRTARQGDLWLAAERRELSDVERVRGRLEIAGPVTAEQLAAMIRLPRAAVDAALLAIEADGVVLRGHFTPGVEDLEWCERRLLARIHRYTISRLRSEIEPVTPAQFSSFLFEWQHVTPDHRTAGLEGLAAVLGQLEGFEVPAGAWETDVLSARSVDYDPQLLDSLSLMGRVMWARVSPPSPSLRGAISGPLRSTPIALLRREHLGAWHALAGDVERTPRGANAALVLSVLDAGGAMFFHDLVTRTGLLGTQVEGALAELAALGLVTADGFTGLRALITPESRRPPIAGASRRRHRSIAFGVESAGRWARLAGSSGGPDSADPGHGATNTGREAAVEHLARTLLNRYGVMFRKLLAREAFSVPWRELLRTYWRLEARGEVRGGRFVSGIAGEQFALPDAVTRLRAVRRAGPQGQLTALSAADPLNLTGILSPEDRVAALAGNRIVYEDGIPVVVKEGGETRWLAALPPERERLAEEALIRKRVSASLRARLGIPRAISSR